ncbi:MAG: restriction endonuclease subunit S [Nitrosomonas sp.]|nr:restriction endonuclease subunit S [Nitrosomonas sp.]
MLIFITDSYPLEGKQDMEKQLCKRLRGYLNPQTQALSICLGQRTMLIRTVEEHYLAKFLLISLMDPKFKSRSEEVAVGTGVKHFRVGDVSDLIVPVPPTEEQIEIVRRVEELFAYADRIEARYHAARARVDKLTPAILAKAFRGELVPQNPDDEPASVLFDRIRTSRAANVATSKPERRRNRVAK